MCYKNIILVLLLTLCHNTTAIVDYCAQNTFSTNTSWLQLNKEASRSEYALDQRFKGLHCCAKGYKSIEWYKDGRTYPWPSSVSNFILYPESANQTIYTTTVTLTDTGNYTCLLRNDTHIYTHTIHLNVFEKIPDAPQTTFTPEPHQEIELGANVRLFCEAFLGRIDLPDAHNEAIWKRLDQNGSVEDARVLQQEKIEREEGETLGVYLVINNINKEDYGDYMCRISKPDRYVDMPVRLIEKIPKEYVPVNPIPWKKMIVISTVVILLLLTIVVLNVQYGLLARVALKDRFEPLEENDGKIQDVLICYSQKDSDIVLGVLLPKLESKYKYKCGSREFSSNVNNWHIEMNESARKSRRVVAVLSPACFNEKWDSDTIYQGLKQLRALGPPINCITLKALPIQKSQLKNDQGETLASTIRKINVINWDRSIDDKYFWLSIRLYLPPKRFQENSTAQDPKPSSVTKPDSTRLNSNSHESLEILV